jgi:hypothetical protein
MIYNVPFEVTLARYSYFLCVYNNRSLDRAKAHR